MSNKTKTKVGFQIADNFHAIISVRENKLGELIISPAFAASYSESEFGNSNAEKKINDQHYTLHHSPQFEEENVLNHTLKFIDGTKINTRIYTRAFKRTNLSCPIFLARGQDFSVDRYKTQKKDNYNYITLGDYNPKIATLYYMVVVSGSEITFKDNFPDINTLTLHFQKFSLLLLWSFGIVPSHSTGSKSHFLTQRGFETQLKEGFSKDEIINLYRQTRQLQHSSFLTFLQQQFHNNPNSFGFLKGIGFKKLPAFSLDAHDKKAIKINNGYDCFILGTKSLDSGFTNDALKLFNVSAEIFKEEGQFVAYANTLNSKGIVFQVTGFPIKSIKCYQESLEIYRKNNLNFHIANVYLNLSVVHRDTADIEVALEMAKKALSVSTKHKFTSLEADANKELGVLYKNLQEINKSFDFLNMALTKYKEDHNLSGEAFCLGNMGLLRALEGKFHESLDFHKHALRIFKSLSHVLGMANEMANVGNMNCVIRNFDLGLRQLNSALEGHRRIDYQYGIATDLKLIGVHFVNKGQRDKGRQCLEESKQLLIKIGNHPEASQISEILQQIGKL